jgi:HEAT repeat protein
MPELIVCLEKTDGGGDLMSVLGGIGAGARAAVPTLTRILREKPYDSSAAETLGRIGPAAESAIPALIEACHHPDDNTRLAAIAALGQIGRRLRQTVPALVQLLHDREETAEWVAAAKALGQIGRGAKAAIPALKIALRDKQVREWAAYALIKITGERGSCLPKLLSFLRDRKADLSGRIECAQVLTMLAPEHKGALAGIKWALADPSRDLREATLNLLVENGPVVPRAVPELITLLRDSSDFTRQMAALVLGRIGPAAKKAIPHLKELAEKDETAVGDTAVEALAKIETGRK